MTDPVDKLRRDANAILKKIGADERVNDDFGAWQKDCYSLIGAVTGRAQTLMSELSGVYPDAIDPKWLETELVLLLKFLRPAKPQMKRGRKSKYVELARFVRDLLDDGAEENWQAFLNKARKEFPEKTQRLELKAFMTGVQRQWEREEKENSAQ
jgi:hypothetical protein